MKYQIGKIAVATNFSTAANNALHYAAVLAQRHQATLDIVHAVSPSESRNKKAQYVSAAYDRLKKYRDEVFDRHHIEPKLFARVGEVKDFLYSYCINNDIDLLIIGVETGVKKYFGEPKAYEIIMKVECPVLSIPASFAKEYFSCVLFPVRDVAGVEEKLLYSKPFINKDHSELHLIHFGAADTKKAEELIALAKGQGIESCTSGYKIANTKNVSSQVIAIAKEEKDDLIVINATSEKEWYKIFGENYTEYILKEADIAVLSVTHSFESK